VYAANQRGVVSDYLKDYVANLATRLVDSDGKSFVCLAIVQSRYLSQRVNHARIDFDLAGKKADLRKVWTSLNLRTPANCQCPATLHGGKRQPLSDTE
jgi:hypothetical protein